MRDIKTNWKLSLMGYRVATVWECSIRSDFGRTVEREILMFSTVHKNF
ncbi:hypothetical protein [uncultured Fibrobacter sp.]|nr:hypothetical protein [uncultured Fibrobacter sp.]